MRYGLIGALSLLAAGCLSQPTTLARPAIRGPSGCTFVVPPDIRPRARYSTRITLDMNEWCQRFAGKTRALTDAI